MAVALSAVDQLIEWCNDPPTVAPNDGTESEALKQFVGLARAAVRSRPDVSALLQTHVGWLGDSVRPGQSVSPQVLQSLSSALMTLPDAMPAGMLARVRSMPSGVQLPAGSAQAGGGLSLTLAEESQFVSSEQRGKQANRLHQAQLAVRRCLNMPTEEQATKRRAENIEGKIFAEAMSQARDDHGRQRFYEQKLHEIYKKMSLLVKSHTEGGHLAGSAAPPAVGAGPFASLASNGLTPQGSLAGRLPSQGSMPQQPLPGVPPPTSVVPPPPRGPPNPTTSAGLGDTAGKVALAPPPAPAPATGITSSGDAKDHDEYWKRLNKLRPHRNFAMRYIQTLDKFTDKTLKDIADSNDEQHKATLTKKRKVAENVRKYLWLLCRLCNDDPGRGGRQMPPNLRLLDVIHKTLEAVYKRQRMPDASANNSRMHKQLGATGTTQTDYTQGVALINTRTQAPSGLRFDYDIESLTWTDDHKRNAENKYCYCGTNKQEPCVQCTVCKQWFHKGCTSDAVPKDGKGWVEFQVNYRFHCKICCSADNQERFELTKCSWLESILGGFQNLMWVHQRDMFKAAEITAHLDEHWEALCHQRDRGDNKKWRNSLNSYLTNNIKKFERPKKFFWSLANPKNDPYGPAVQPCRLFQSETRAEPPEQKPERPPKPKPPKPKPVAVGRKPNAPVGRAPAPVVPVRPIPPVSAHPIGPPYMANAPWDHTGGGVVPSFDPMGPVGSLSDPENMMWDTGFGEMMPDLSPPSTGQEMDTVPWDSGEGMFFGGGSDTFMSTTSFAGELDDDSLSTPTATPIDDEEEHDARCPTCSLGARWFGSAERNQYICVKCDQDEHKNLAPDLNKAKIPNNVVVWNAQVSVGDDPVPYKVTICHKCHTDVEKAGHLVWEAKKTEIKASDFKQEPYEDPAEEWVECEFCNQWYHQVCVRFDKQIYGDKLAPLCPNESCRFKREQAYPDVLELNHTSADLKASTLSNFLEARVESEVFAETERSGKHGVTVRVISNVQRSVNFNEVAGKVGGRYKRQENVLPYKQKNIFAFFRCPDGAEIAFFALQVQEYGADCPAPNTNTAYISYLDSNQLYHCPGCGAHDDVIGRDTWTNPGGAPSLCTMKEQCKRERRKIYDALFVGYMEYLKRRGLHRAYIWAMPPEPDSDYVFYYRPRDMHLPTAEQLEKWYIRVLEKAQETGAIKHFEDNTGRRDSNQGEKRKKSARRDAGFLFQPPTPGRGRRGEGNGDGDGEAAQDADGPPAKKAKGGEGNEQESADASSDERPSLSHFPIFKGDRMAGVIEHVLTEKEKKETGSRKTTNSSRSQTADGTDGPGLGRTQSKSLVDEVTHYMTDESQGSYIRCTFEAAEDESFTADIEDDPIISIDEDKQGMPRSGTLCSVLSEKSNHDCLWLVPCAKVR